MTLLAPADAPCQRSFDLGRGEAVLTVSAEGVLTRYRLHGAHHEHRDEPLDAFRGGVWRHCVPPSAALEIHGRIASLLDPATLSAIDQRRVLFLRHHHPERVTHASFAYPVLPTPADAPHALDLELSPAGLLGASPRSVDGTRKLHMPDEIFFLGPTEPGMPLALRRALRLALHASLEPAAGIALAEAFPLLDHDRIEPRSWTLQSTPDGSEDAVVSGGTCTVSYRFGHDQGSTEWSVERTVASPEPLAQAPDAIRQQIIAHILQARLLLD